MNGRKSSSSRAMWPELPLGGVTLKATWKMGLKKYLTRSQDRGLGRVRRAGAGRTRKSDDSTVGGM